MSRGGPAWSGRAKSREVLPLAVRRVVDGDSIPAHCTGADVERWHSTGLRATRQHELGQRRANGSEILGLADAWALQAEAIAQPSDSIGG